MRGFPCWAPRAFGRSSRRSRWVGCRRRPALSRAGLRREARGLLGAFPPIRQPRRLFGLRRHPLLPRLHVARSHGPHGARARDPARCPDRNTPPGHGIEPRGLCVLVSRPLLVQRGGAWPREGDFRLVLAVLERLGRGLFKDHPADQPVARLRIRTRRQLHCHQPRSVRPGGLVVVATPQHRSLVLLRRQILLVRGVHQPPAHQLCEDLFGRHALQTVQLRLGLRLGQ